MFSDSSFFADNQLKADFHIHSCHSACGSLDMSPKNIIDFLIKNNIKISAISDHNSMKNCNAYIKLAKLNNICIFPAMEIQSEEEIHLVVIFPNLDIAYDWQKWIDDNLPYIPLNPEIFGDQPIVDEQDNILELPENLYSISIPFSFDQIEKKAYKDNLLFFPAHINDSSYSIISQIGFIPENHLFKVAEVSKLSDYEIFTKSNPEILLITNSDAHYLNQIGLRYNLICSKKLFEIFDRYINCRDDLKLLENYKNEIYEKLFTLFSNNLVKESKNNSNFQEFVKPVFNK